MKLRLLPSAFHRPSAAGDPPPAQPLTSFIVEGAGGAGPLAIDAGSIGLVGAAEDMARTRELILTHAHIDHIASLPMWLEALVSQGRAPIRVHASAAAIETLRAHVFNGAVYPDFEAIKDADGRALLELVEFPVEENFDLAGFTVRAFEVDHPVATHGLLVDDGENAVIFGADSGPTERLWEVAASAPRVRVIVLETSFPDHLQSIADGAGHLTPATLATELAKAPKGVRVLITHLKPAYREEIITALAELGDSRLRVLDPGVQVEIGAELRLASD